MKKKFISTKLNNNICCFDLETSDKNPYTCEPLEITAMVYDMNTLQLKEGGIFHTLIKPSDWSKVSHEALQKNKIDPKEVKEKGVEQEFFFRQFTDFCNSFQRKRDNKWEAMYSCGYNILNFDNIIMDQLCYKYNYLDKNGDPMLFHPIHNFDLIHIIRMWFHGDDILASYSLDGLRDYMGISKEGSHRSTKDVEDTWKILSRFLNMYRQMSPKRIPQFKGCFCNDTR